MKKNNKNIKKVLILGSGALKIGEAGEFDYSGSQAIKVLKEEGIKTILVNPNIATIQTSKEMADEVYFLPINAKFVEEIIKKEKPDGIFLSFGGQTALNCGIELFNKGILKKNNVQILGTPISAIILTEDREKFSAHLNKINIPTPISEAATTLKGALKIAQKIGYPVMLRAGFALGGQGSGIASNPSQLKSIAERALAFSPQILVERYLHHYKEIEYEVVRDKKDNCITVCNMENMDPLGIHTGDSIVVAPSQTLNNEEYHELRRASIDIVRSLGIVGECNVQFALNPRKLEYFVIEVNARLSRSSALASKATGYPLAYIAAKLALGYDLTNTKNKVTGVTSACFEPALDYVVIKIPRFDMDKFKGADNQLGSSMKSVGEVMGIGRTFEEGYQKAIRMLDMDYESATDEKIFQKKSAIIENLKNPTPKRMFTIAKALKDNLDIKKIYKLTGVDPWFLYRIKNIVDHEKTLSKTKKLDKDFLLELKQIGFSDKRIGELVGKTGLEIRKIRKSLNITPFVLQIDTLSAEFPAKTNYLYMTYNASHNDVESTGNKSVIVLGSGPYHIGSSVEFDWCSVNTVQNLKNYNMKSIVINCNPETVSTDYDLSHKLYFEELTFERITDIYEFENPQGVIVSVGGQTPNNRAKALYKYGVKILGTNPENIDKAEDRSKFSALLDKLKIKQPAWNAFSTLQQAEKFAEKVGYPVLIRPSYVLSGSAMNICFDKDDLIKFLNEAALISKEYPVTVSKFFQKSKEVELDAVAQNGVLKTSVISEHIEYAGVHSGDATIVLPAKNIDELMQSKMKDIAKKLSESLDITGPFNIQFLVQGNEAYIIEANLRASRTFPFIAKVTGVNLIKLFVDSLFQKNIPTVAIPKLKFTAVKVPQFSFARLTGSDPILGVEMASTGEVACFGEDLEEAYLKGMLSTGSRIPEKGIFISIGGDKKKQDFIEGARYASLLGLPIYATENTSKFLKENGIKSTRLYKIYDHKSPNVIDQFQNKKIDLVININEYKDTKDAFKIRRAAVDSNIPVMTKIKTAKLFLKALNEKRFMDLEIKPWSSYLGK
ncbi:MAG TPA: carbamoyl-phosphate synthase (glutamine-hydrolyzing) large subunit [Candidatus Limnocylindrales bacterium]|nr:carbamoyl-phosphate synthase (glutamine-hydrolyzing) large subunit [Candidatus Limnocylindrales bacterium]